MAYGIVLLRVVLGATIAAHGAQKLFGSFGGPGLQGTGGFFRSLGFRSPLAMAVLAAEAEFGGGVLLCVGFLTPLAALAIAAVMLTAIGSVHLRNGFWNTNQGYEFNLLILTAAIALSATGGGRFSIDAALGWAEDLSGLWWGVGVAGGSILIALVNLTFGRSTGAPVAEAAPEAETVVRRAA